MPKRTPPLKGMSADRRDGYSGDLRPHANPFLQRRVLTIEEFAHERRRGRKLTPEESLAKFGNRVVPIPVPLDPGETEEQYERALLACYANASKSTQGVPVRERVRRCGYAATRLAAYTARQKTAKSDALPPRPVHKTDTRAFLGAEMTEESIQAAQKSFHLKTLREELYVKRYVDLDEYRKMVRNGLFARIKGMSVNEREREFGSQIVPIYVPLARGETMAEYEERFGKWLWKKETLTLEELEKHPNPAQERYMRLMFTHANARGDECYVPSTSQSWRERELVEELQREERPHKKRKEEPTKDDVGSAPKSVKFTPARRGACLGQDTVSSMIACGCRRCLMNGMRSLAAKITAAEANQRKRREDAAARAVRVEDLASDTESTVSGSISSPPRGAVDPILNTLNDAYDAINEQIVMNERVLDSSATRLATTPIMDVAETTQIQDEDEEMREIIREEMKNRSMALAVLIVYMWREEVDELMKIVDDPNASDVMHIQRAAHHKCAQLAADWESKHQAVHHLQDMEHALTSKESTMGNEPRLSGSMSGADLQLQSIQQQRRREFIKLVHFDQHIRQLIRGLLVRVNG